jgi:hypothetical protein
MHRKLACPRSASIVNYKTLRDESPWLDDREILQGRFSFDFAYCTGSGHHGAKPYFQSRPGTNKITRSVPSEADGLSDQATEIKLHFNQQRLGEALQFLLGGCAQFHLNRLAMNLDHGLHILFQLHGNSGQ